MSKPRPLSDAPPPEPNHAFIGADPAPEGLITAPKGLITTLRRPQLAPATVNELLKGFGPAHRGPGPASPLTALRGRPPPPSLPRFPPRSLTRRRHLRPPPVLSPHVAAAPPGGSPPPRAPPEPRRDPPGAAPAAPSPLRAPLRSRRRRRRFLRGLSAKWRPRRPQRRERRPARPRLPVLLADWVARIERLAESPPEDARRAVRMRLLSGFAQKIGRGEELSAGSDWTKGAASARRLDSGAVSQAKEAEPVAQNLRFSPQDRALIRRLDLICRAVLTAGEGPPLPPPEDFGGVPGGLPEPAPPPFPSPPPRPPPGQGVHGADQGRGGAQIDLPETSAGGPTGPNGRRANPPKKNSKETGGAGAALPRGAPGPPGWGGPRGCCRGPSPPPRRRPPNSPTPRLLPFVEQRREKWHRKKFIPSPPSGLDLSKMVALMGGGASSTGGVASPSLAPPPTLPARSRREEAEAGSGCCPPAGRPHVATHFRLRLSPAPFPAGGHAPLPIFI
ncbi:basic proline-rich protein-like [Haemorhous mexicanus]|uniref:basic proline-rich protein-like n=1 Tax=Haemorhous mexicanus TaxID=30427 RepID=UPI0028BE90A3|nr:basic proline-rich protein-like [Haemorhous mexicanus]